MALYKFGITGELRGSIGGITFSRNKAGAVIRSKTKNNFVKPLLKIKIMNIFGYLSNYWNTTLDDTQRGDWEDYAGLTPLTNSLHETYYMSGLNAFIRANSIGIKISQPIIEEAPITGGFTPVGTIVPAQIATNCVAQSIEISEAALPAFDHSVSDDCIIVFQCPCCYKGKNFIFFKERFIGSIIGDSGAPPAPPWLFNVVWPIFIGGIIGLVFRRLDPVGKYSGKTAAGIEVLV